MAIWRLDVSGITITFVFLLEKMIVTTVLLSKEKGNYCEYHVSKGLQYNSADKNVTYLNIELFFRVNLQIKLA